MITVGITVEAALKMLAEKMPDWGTAPASLHSLENAVTAEALIADRDYPPFDRVMMDGIAISYEAYESGLRRFPITGVCAAGSPKTRLTDFSQALEVMTGAPLPEGASLVVPYEALKIEAGVATITEEEERDFMEFVHRSGSDSKKGEVLLASGKELTPPNWGIAASLGYSEVKARREPKVAIISTGDELVAIDAVPAQHQIRRSNAYALKASLLSHGFSDVSLFHLADREAEIENHYREASKCFDLLIYSGGVSKGKFDYLPSVWKKCGVTEYFHGVRQKPGKPLWFGVDPSSSTAVIGLPGNPVSSLVCLHRYFLSKKVVYARLSEEISFEPEMTYFVPVKTHSTADGVFHATPLAIQNSGDFSALAESDGFIELPPEPSRFKPGEAFRYHAWRLS